MIHVHLSYLPPSSNHAYATHKKQAGSFRTLSRSGVSFKRTAGIDLLRGGFVSTRMLPDKQYGLAFLFVLKALYCKGWPKSSKARYKKIDVSNRVKLLEDCLSNITGIDDSQFFPIIVSKAEGGEGTHVWMWSVEDEPKGARHALEFIAQLQ